MALLCLVVMAPGAGSAAGTSSGVHRAVQRMVQPAKRVRASHNEGYQDLYTDGPGSGFGFHPGPGIGRYPGRAAISRARQAYALRETMAIDQLTRGHGYGSPFYAGYYGPGAGYETGLGRSY